MRDHQETHNMRHPDFDNTFLHQRAYFEEEEVKEAIPFVPLMDAVDMTGFHIYCIGFHVYTDAEVTFILSKKQAEICDGTVYVEASLF